MPQAFFLVGPFGVGGGTLLNAIGIRVPMGLYGKLTGIGQKPKTPTPTDGQETVTEAIGSRKRNYGIVHTGGQRTFLDSSGGTLGIVVTLGTGEEGEIVEHRINDKVVTVSGGTITDSSFHGAVHIYTRNGADDQTAIAELTAKFSQWTSDHRQRGCAHAAVICDPVKQENFSEVFSGQMPAYTQVRHGVSVYDPRKDDTAVIGGAGDGSPIMGSGTHRLADKASWEWSDNGSLVIADYFAHPDGYGAGYDNVNWTNIAQEADHCDETVTTVTADTIARWRIWASYGLASEQRSQVLANMAKAIDAFYWQDANGKFNLMTGRFEEPDITFTDDHILSMSATLGVDASQQASGLKMLYTEAAIGYREQESAIVRNPDSTDDPNTDPQAVDLYYAPHHNQAVRVGKIMVRQLGDRWHLVPVLNLYGLNALGRRFVRVDSARAGISGYFKVDGLRLNTTAQPPTIEATLSEVKSDDWEFDATLEEGDPPSVPGTSAPVVTIPAPSGLTLTAVQIALGDTNAVAIGASWDDPGRVDLSWDAQYRPSAGGDWITMSVDEDARTASSGPVNSGVSYDVQVFAVTITGRRSSESSATITPTAASAALGAPNGLAATGGTGAADVAFRMPTSASLAYARLYRATHSTFGTAVQVGSDIVGGLGQVMTIHDSGLSSGAKYYWARAFDGAGGQSLLTGPVSVTVT